MNIGYVNFDGKIGDNSISEILTKSDKIEKIFRNKYVLIREPENNSSPKQFVGRIVDGPFYTTEEVGSTSAIAQACILRADDLPALPNYYGLELVEVLGNYVDNKLIPSGTRPRPKSDVSELDDKDVVNIIGMSGDMSMGKLSGYDNIGIGFDSKDKKVLPRNIGIFGTVGSGKSNTAQVLIEEALQTGYSVIVFDVEGEYVKMDEPTTELHSKLSEFGLTPAGVNLQVYYPAPAEESRKDAKRFGVKFSNFDLYILFEIINASDAQERAFSALVDALERGKKSKQSQKKGPMTKEESGYNEITLEGAISKLDELIDQKTITGSSGKALRGKLSRVNRYEIFDQDNVEEIKASDLLSKNKLTIIDVSTCTDHVKNITIVDVLKKIFDEKISNENAPKTLIMIEEAHTFISKESRDRMEATIDHIKTIARRGRKRWLSLCFISQQPSHIPNEIFELSNTRIVHSIKSEANIQALKNTTGGVIESVWNSLPTLGQGQALIISPQYTHPIIAQIRPAKSRRTLVE